MIIREANNGSVVLYEPESAKERIYLETFPGFIREGLHFFSPSKPRVVANLYSRLRRKVTNIRYTTFIQSILDNPFPSKELPASFKFYTKPLPHQMLALRFLYTQGSAGLLLDPGLGKTKIILDYIYLMQFKKSIIVCPKPLLHVWRDESFKHRPELKVHLITTTDWEIEKKGVESADIVVINYSKVTYLLEELQKLKAEFLGLDEALIKDYTTDRTKTITKLGRATPYKCIMSGTLINNTPLDSFAPIRFVEVSSVGERVTDFKARYAHTAKSNKNIIVGFRDTPEIKSIIDATCIVMRKEEWLKDLPAKKFNRIICPIDGEARELYNGLASNWLCTLPDGSELAVDNPLTRMGKMLQIANGFIYYGNEKDPLEEMLEEPKKRSNKDRKTHTFDDSPKIKGMDSLIHDPKRMGGKRAIIWFNFQAEADIIEKYLNSKGIKYLSIKGGEKKVGDKIGAFNTDPSYRFILCQARTINYGVTVLGTDNDDYELPPEFEGKISDQIFYSINFSLEVFLQQQDRIHRIGQTQECNYWILLTNSCIEEKVWKAMQDKVFLNKTLLVDISKQVKVL